MSEHQASRLARLAPAATAATAGCEMAAVAAALFIPAAVAEATNRILAGDNARLALVVLAGLLTVRVLAEIGDAIATAYASTRIAAALRHALIRQVFALGVAGRRHHDTGALVARLTGNAAAAATAVPTMAGIAVEGMASTGGLVALCVIDWRLGAAFVIAVVPAVVVLRTLMKRIGGAYSDYLVHQTAIVTRLADALTGIRTIRACGTERREITRVLGPLPDLARAGANSWRLQRAASWQLEAMLTLLRVVVLAVGGFSVAAGRITPGEFVAIPLYLGYALGVIYQGDTLVYLAHARSNAGRVFDVLDQRPATRAERLPAINLPSGPGALCFRHVSVRLDDRVVLNRLCLDVPAGAAVAVVGRSGTGKTTLALLAGKLIDPDDGEVLIDGTRIDALDQASLRREVTYAFDRPALLGRTVRDAITYGLAEVADGVAERAARLANADEFIRRLPDGFDTPLADVRFSGGETQRLGLARALAGHGRLMIMDDATSSLDTVTEAEVTEAITASMAGRTRLLITHRVTTAARADLVAWLESGRIRALAPHHELWQVEPEYRALFSRGDQ